jgi:hypothetical protein
VTTDLTARIAELAASIEADVAEDEAVARSVTERQPYDEWDAVGAGDVDDVALSNWRVVGIAIPGLKRADSPAARSVMQHIARNDPARTLRRVKATRDLVAEILAEQHEYVEGDPWFSCSQAVRPGEDDDEPGSGCVDDKRAGQPCDCGRDARAARLLGIIASEWEGSREEGRAGYPGVR